MAVNERPDKWDNQHTAILMRTGGGKSVYIKKVLPSRGIRALFWDIDKDHQCKHYSNWAQFVRAVAAAHRSGKPFRIGWAGDDTRGTFERWLELYWEILDGEMLTYGVVEELADVSISAGDSKGFERKVLNRSRKYGGRFVCATQRPQEISKTVFSACSIKVIGVQALKDVKYLINATGLTEWQIRNLKRFDRTKPGGPSNCCQYWEVTEGDGFEYIGIDPTNGKTHKKHPKMPEL